MKDGRRKKEDDKYGSSSFPSLPSFTFVGGKGGVGKTTYAAIAALEAPSLLVSTDPATSLSDVLRTQVRGVPTRVAPGLHAASLDAASAFARWLEPRRPVLAVIGVRGTYLDDEDVARLLKLSLPGIDEIIGLLEIVRLARGNADGSPSFDRVIVDTAPTGHTLRLLAAPALLARVAGVLDLLQSHHRTVVAALRGSYVADAADRVIQELDRDGRMLAALLRDPASTTMAWVTLPEPMALEETADAIGALEREGIRVGRLIVNRVTGDGQSPWCEARRRFEMRALAPVARRFSGREMLVLPDLGEEPRGVGALRRAASRLSTFEPPASAPPVGTRLRADLPTRFSRNGQSPLFSYVKGMVPFFDARWLLFGGKGGVGKSTCAAAAALAAARERRVLLISTDPAHSLGDAFGVPLDDTPRVVRGGPATLHVRELDAAAEFERFRSRYEDAVDEAFARIARTAHGDRSALRDLIDLAPPGIDEVMSVAEIASALSRKDDNAYDLVVTDTAPTGHALRLLHTPGILREWTHALMTILRKYREIIRAGALAELLVHLSGRLRALQAMLSDAARTRVIVVTRPDVLPVEEAVDLMNALDAISIRVGGVIVNALGAPPCSRGARGPQSDRTPFARLIRATVDRGGCAIIGAPAEVPPPHGAAALADWSGAWRQLA